MSVAIKTGPLIGAAILAVLLLGGLAALILAPDPGVIDVARRLLPPSRAHWLGTDALGRDALALLAGGGRASLGVAAAAVVIGVGLGVPLGLLAAARAGWIDELAMRAADLLFAFPALLTAILIVAVAGPGADKAALAIGLFNIPVFARVTRGAAGALWRQDFVLAARVAGRGRLAISAAHILPNLAQPLLTQGAIQLGLGILAEAGLSYVGLGAQPPTPSWGRMLADGQTLLDAAPWLAIAPGAAIVLAVLAINLVATGSRR